MMNCTEIYNHFVPFIEQILNSDYSDELYYCDHSFDINEHVYMVSGVTRAAIVDENYDWIVKYDIDCHEYCEREIDLYQKAICNRLEMCFPECAYIGTFQDIPLYAFRKAKCNYHSRNLFNEELEYIKTHKSPLSERNKSVAADLLKSWNEDIFEALSEFCYENEINDLHGNNVGWIDGKLVLIDFAGYSDSEEDY